MWILTSLLCWNRCIMMTTTNGQNGSSSTSSSAHIPINYQPLVCPAKIHIFLPSFFIYTKICPLSYSNESFLYYVRAVLPLMFFFLLFNPPLFQNLGAPLDFNTKLLLFKVKSTTNKNIWEHILMKEKWNKKLTEYLCQWTYPQINCSTHDCNKSLLSLNGMMCKINNSF